jgi:glycogen synthase
MQILLTSAEVAPFAKVGGLADVAGALPYALAACGGGYPCDYAWLWLYRAYIHIRLHGCSISLLTHRHGTADVSVFTTVHDGVPFYFVQAWPLSLGKMTKAYLGWEQDIPRFIFFNQIAMATAWELGRRLGLVP